MSIKQWRRWVALAEVSLRSLASTCLAGRTVLKHLRHNTLLSLEPVEPIIVVG